jgi:hypothetical protein
MPCSQTVALYKWYALTKETRRVYGSAIKPYEGFCRDKMVARPWYPALSKMVQEWLAWMGLEKTRKRRLDYGTINKYKIARRSYCMNLNPPYTGVINSSTKAVVNGIRNYHASRPNTVLSTVSNSKPPKQPPSPFPSSSDSSTLSPRMKTNLEELGGVE